MKKKVLKDKFIKMDKIKMLNIVVFTIALVLNFSCVFGETDPTLVNKLNSALKKIQRYLVKLATPAAGVAIASGVMIRKLSFGNEEKMAIGKKVIVNAIICYGVIISINLILKFIDTLLK